MLETLTIRHLALIDDVSIQFHSGLHVLTGETGAGKSIVVDAVNLILGGRADRDLIRSGCEKATVEAVFDISCNSGVKEFLENESIETDGHTAVIYREISAGGKNICRICGIVIPLGKLKAFSSLLLDLHGQSEHQFLADPVMHCYFLDQTGGKTHQKMIQEVKSACNAFLENHREYAKLIRQNETRKTRLSILEQELNELHQVNLQPGEDQELRDEKKRLQEDIKSFAGLRDAYDYITQGENGDSVLGRTKAACDKLRSVTESSRIRELSERCESMYYEMEEISYELSMIVEKTRTDPQRLEYVENRLDLIRRLERKYSLSADELMTAVSDMEKEYDTLCSLDDIIRSMAAEHKRLLSAYRSKCRELTDSRQKLARAFESRMMTELKELGMENTRFNVKFQKNDSGKPMMPSENGDDRLEFMISPNPGEPLKPLAKIASGGELSRLMLAVKTLEASHTGVDSMIFDEIDTGISGRTAQVVAEKMIAISRERQVICVTHLPQLAAAADYQYLVRKNLIEDRTVTGVSELDREQRIHEVARMISGAEGTNPEAIEYASGMLLAAEKLKKQQHSSE